MTYAIHFDRHYWPEEAAALERFDRPGLLAVGIDLQNPAPGLGAIVNARRVGVPVAVLPLFLDPLERILLQITDLIRQNGDPEQRAQLIAALRDGRLKFENKTPYEGSAPSPEVVKAAKFAVRAADLVLFATATEHARFERVTNLVIRRWAFLPDAMPYETPPGSGITIYAPELPVASLGGIALGVAFHHTLTQVICEENARERVAGRVVVIPQLWRAQRAATLASAGYRVAVPEECGAESRHSGITTFKMADLYSIGDAIDSLESMPFPRPMISISTNAAQESLALQVPAKQHGPPISIVMRTANRQLLLRRAIASIARQSYADIEIIVVNNGSESVRDLVDSALQGRPVTHIEPITPLRLGAALNAGMSAAKGEYVGYLDDDDILYPDHCARAIDVLESSGADFCYSNCVGEYSRIERDGVKHVLGMQIYTDRPYRIDDLFASNLTTIHSVVHRRSLFERFGYTDESLAVTEDWELWLRMAVGGARFIHLDRATCEYSWRDDPGIPHTSKERRRSFLDAYQTIISRYASHVANRGGSVLTAQQHTLDHLRARAGLIGDNLAVATKYDMEDVLVHSAPVEGLVDL